MLWLITPLGKGINVPIFWANLMPRVLIGVSSDEPQESPPI